MTRHLTRTATLLALFVCTTITPYSHAQIVSDANGTIELRLNAFQNGGPPDNMPDVIETFTIGLEDAHPVLDRSNARHAGGLSKVDYEYLPLGPAEAQFNIYTFSDSLNRSDGDGGHALINFDITVPAPFSYRFEAIADNTAYDYEVSFNNTSAYAHSYDAIYGGTFPLRHFYEDGILVYTHGWHPYIDQGILPAGTYNVTTSAISITHGRYGVGIDSEGSASLHIQLLGDTDLDGKVGMQDLDTVLASWNQSAEPDGSTPADLNGDGFIGIDDLGQVLTAWNADVRPISQPASVTHVPEPTTAGLFSVCVLALTGDRTRRAYLVTNTPLGTES